MPPAGDDQRSITLDVRSLAALAASVAATVVLLGLARTVPRTLSTVAVAGLLALGFDPVISAVSRRLRLPRSAALALVVALFGLGLALVAVTLVPPAVRQARALGEDLPEVIADLRRLPVVGDDLDRAGLPERVEAFINELPARLAGEDTPLLDAGRSAFDGLLAGMVMSLLLLGLLLDGPRLLRGGRRLVPPRHVGRADRIGRLVARVVGRYVAGSVVVALIAGLANLIAGLLLGVPLAPLLAVWVCLWSLVPQIGGAAGGVPFVALGFTQGPVVGLACAAFFMVYLQVENNIVSPLVVGQAVKLSPPATMVAALIGMSAGGVVGALVAIPLLGAVKATYLELRPPTPARPARTGARAATAGP